MPHTTPAVTAQERIRAQDEFDQCLHDWDRDRLVTVLGGFCATLAAAPYPGYRSRCPTCGADPGADCQTAVRDGHPGELRALRTWEAHAARRNVRTQCLTAGVPYLADCHYPGITSWIHLVFPPYPDGDRVEFVWYPAQSVPGTYAVAIGKTDTLLDRRRLRMSGCGGPGELFTLLYLARDRRQALSGLALLAGPEAARVFARPQGYTGPVTDDGRLLLDNWCEPYPGAWPEELFLAAACREDYAGIWPYLADLPDRPGDRRD